MQYEIGRDIMRGNLGIGNVLVHLCSKWQISVFWKKGLKKMPPHDWPIGKDIRHFFFKKQLTLEGPDHYEWCLFLADDPELYKS